jgi:hypothetical protein
MKTLTSFSRLIYRFEVEIPGRPCGGDEFVREEEQLMGSKVFFRFSNLGKFEIRYVFLKKYGKRLAQLQFKKRPDPLFYFIPFSILA